MSTFRRRGTFCIAAFALGFSGSLLWAPTAANAQLAALAVQGGLQLGGCILDKTVIEPCFDKLTGRMNRSEMERLIKMLAEHDKQNGAQYAAMQSALRDRMTRREVEALMMETLEKINPTLAEHTRQIRQLEETTSIHRQLIEHLSADAEFATLMQARHGVQIKELDARVDRIEKMYPRYTPEQQAASLGASGFRFLLNNDNHEATRCFRFAHGFEPKNPGFVYGLAIAYRRDKQPEYAEILLARGIALERTRSLRYEDWWRNSVEKFQGPDRRWLEDARWDPIYGIRAYGMIRVPDVDLQPLKSEAVGG